MFTSKYFSLGRVVVTQAINHEFSVDERFSMDVLISLRRYCLMDWGNVSEESKQMNDIAVMCSDDRILAEYEICKGKIWIITEGDRSITTVLFPAEY